MHRVIVLGRLGQDPKVFKDSVAKFGIASDEMGKTTMWFNAVIFKAGLHEKAWEFITKLKKGDSVFADGNLKEGEYEDKNGEKKKAIDFIVSTITYGSGGKKAPEGSETPKNGDSGAAPKPAPKGEASKKQDDNEEPSIPF